MEERQDTLSDLCKLSHSEFWRLITLKIVPDLGPDSLKNLKHIVQTSFSNDGQMVVFKVDPGTGSILQEILLAGLMTVGDIFLKSSKTKDKQFYHDARKAYDEQLSDAFKRAKKRNSK
jgi:hypothetical protein